MKRFELKGELDTLDGIAFHYAEHADVMYVRVFTRPITPELLERIKDSGLDPMRPIRASLTLEQEET